MGGGGGGYQRGGEKGDLILAAGTLGRHGIHGVLDHPMVGQGVAGNPRFVPSPVVSRFKIRICLHGGGGGGGGKGDLILAAGTLGRHGIRDVLDHPMVGQGVADNPMSVPSPVVSRFKMGICLHASGPRRRSYNFSLLSPVAGKLVVRGAGLALRNKHGAAVDGPALGGAVLARHRDPRAGGAVAGRARGSGGRAGCARDRDPRAVAGILPVHLRQCQRHHHVRRHWGPAARWWALQSPTVGRVGAAGEEFCSVYAFKQYELTLFLFQLQVKMEATHQDYVLQVERAVTLEQYANEMMPLSLLLNEPPEGQDASMPAASTPLRLCRVAQRLFYLSIQMLSRLIALRRVPRAIGRHNIVLTLPYFYPKLTGVDFLENPTEAQIDLSMSHLADVFEEMIRLRDPTITMPTEVHNLLSFMRSPGVRPNLPLIRVQSSLMPMENRGHLFVILYQYTVDVLRINEPPSYRFIIKELVYNRYWEVMAEQNIYLQRLFERGHYDPTGARVSMPQTEPMKYNRHGPCHALQDAAHPDFPHGLRYTFSSINHGLYTISEMLLASLQTSLHRMGHLAALDTESLFPWG